MIETKNLRLSLHTSEQLIRLIEQPDRYEELAGYPAAAGLRDFFVSGEVTAEWLARLRERRGATPWETGFIVIHPERRLVIGLGAFKGPPDATGMVEIAYAIVPAFEGRGYATEVAKALVDYAFNDSSVRLVRAHTLPAPNASTRVLAKCGFQRVEDVVDPDDGPVWRWELARDPVSDAHVAGLS